MLYVWLVGHVSVCTAPQPVSFYSHVVVNTSVLEKIHRHLTTCGNVVEWCTHTYPQYYASVSDAIKSSSLDEPTRILIHPGVYTESIVIDRPVQLIGAGKYEQHHYPLYRNNYNSMHVYA